MSGRVGRGVGQSRRLTGRNEKLTESGKRPLLPQLSQCVARLLNDRYGVVATSDGSTGRHGPGRRLCEHGFRRYNNTVRFL